MDDAAFVRRFERFGDLTGDRTPSELFVHRPERAGDLDGVLAHFARIPEIHIYSDGQRLSYEATAAPVPDAALATGTFRESTTDGRQTTGVHGVET